MYVTDSQTLQTPGGTPLAALISGEKPQSPFLFLSPSLFARFVAMNLVYPVLRPSVPWGDSLLRVLDPENPRLTKMSPEMLQITVDVDWGPSTSQVDSNVNAVCSLTVRALSALGTEPRQVCSTQAIYGEPFSVTWSIDEPDQQVAVSLDAILDVASAPEKHGITGQVEGNPIGPREKHFLVACEYILELQWCTSSFSASLENDSSQGPPAREEAENDTLNCAVSNSRYLHLIPPIHPDAFCESYFSDLVAPGSCNLEESIGMEPAKHVVNSDSELKETIRSIVAESLNSSKRVACHNLNRGFGIEIECLTFCADPETTGCFTKKQEVRKFIEHLMHDDPETAHTGAAPEHASHVAHHKKELLARVARWDIIKEVQLEPFAPAIAHQVFEQERRVCSSSCGGSCACADQNSRMQALLGLDMDTDNAWSSAVLFPSEFKSPAPPHELSLCSSTRDVHREGEAGAAVWAGDAEAEIALVFVILKHLGVAMPPMTRLGHSSAGLHVHVNVCAGAARGASLSAKQILSVVLAWVRFEHVTRHTCKPWKWRDRCSGTLWPTGPEFLFDETVWTQGTHVSSASGARCQYDLPTFVRVVHGVLRDADAGRLGEEECDAMLMSKVLLNTELLHRTLGRHCSLNLLSIKTHGTLEFRRMDATLDARWVVAWARFCVSFVESFQDYSAHAQPFLDASTADVALDRLRRMQESCMATPRHDHE